MSETITVAPPVKYDTDSKRIVDNTDPIELVPLEVEPGNSVLKYGIGGDLDDVEFTVYLPLKQRRQVDDEFVWVDTTTLVVDDSVIVVRGRTCRARVHVWKSQRSRRGGIAVLCQSATGKAA